MPAVAPATTASTSRPTRNSTGAEALAHRSKVGWPDGPPRHPRRAPRLGLGVGAGQGGAAPQRRRRHPVGRRPVPRDPRLRGDRPAAARERPPRRARRDLPRRAGPGEDAHDPLARSRCSTSGCRSSPGRRSTTTRTRRCRPTPAGSSRSSATATPIEWVHRDRRYGEKLATPDTSIADLIGEVDPIKVAEGRYLSDELTLHYGLVPRTQPRHLRHQRAARPRRAHPGRSAQRARGARRPGARLQGAAAARRVPRRVGEPRGLHEPGPHHHAAEGPLRRPDPHALPARDRDRGRHRRAGGPARSRCPGLRVSVPPFLVDVVVTLSHLARQSPHVNQRSGVSVRLSVANRETLVANAARRALRLGETDVVPRIADLESLASSTQGKIEIETRRRGPRRPGRRAPAQGGRAHGVPRPAPHRAAAPGARGVRGRRGRAHRRRRRRRRGGVARRAHPCAP